MKPSTAAAMAKPLRRKKLISGPTTVPASQAPARPSPPDRPMREATRLSSCAWTAIRSAAGDSRTNISPMLQRTTTTPSTRKAACQ